MRDEVAKISFGSIKMTENFTGLGEAFKLGFSNAMVEAGGVTGIPQWELSVQKENQEYYSSMLEEMKRTNRILESLEESGYKEGSYTPMSGGYSSDKTLFSVNG